MRGIPYFNHCSQLLSLMLMCPALSPLTFLFTSSQSPCLPPQALQGKSPERWTWQVHSALKDNGWQVEGPPMTLAGIALLLTTLLTASLGDCGLISILPQQSNSPSSLFPPPISAFCLISFTQSEEGQANQSLLEHWHGSGSLAAHRTSQEGQTAQKESCLVVNQWQVYQLKESSRFYSSLFCHFSQKVHHCHTFLNTGNSWPASQLS